MRVGFDVDGVLFNFGKCVEDYLIHTGRADVWKSGDDLKPTWDFYKKFRDAWTDEEFVAFCNEAADAGFLFRGNVRDNAVAAVQAVKDAGHKIIVVTDRNFGSHPSVSWRATRDWWIEYEFPMYDELIFSADKTSVRTDVFVEDKVSNYQALWRAGTPCFLVTRPWNEDLNAGSFFRINDVVEYPEKVEWVAARLEEGVDFTKPLLVKN